MATLATAVEPLQDFRGQTKCPAQQAMTRFPPGLNETPQVTDVGGSVAVFKAKASESTCVILPSGMSGSSF